MWDFRVGAAFWGDETIRSLACSKDSNTKTKGKA